MPFARSHPWVAQSPYSGAGLASVHLVALAASTVQVARVALVAPIVRVALVVPVALVALASMHTVAS